MQLNSIGESIWLIEGEIVNFYGFPYPTRCIVIKLHNDDLWVWSPTTLTEQLINEVNTLGRVAHLVSPNKIHNLYLKDWKDAYPDALLWGPDSTIRKRPDLSFQTPLTEHSPSQWRDEIDQIWFRGSPAMDEIVFFHHLSSTAILADLSENFSAEFLRDHWSPWKRTIARLWKIVEGYGYAPLEWRLSWFNRSPARAALKKLLGLNPTRIIMAHGVWQQDNGREYLKKAFAWL